MGRHVKPRRVLIPMHEGLVPPPDDEIAGMTPEQISPFKTGHHVASTLRKLGHDVRILGLHDDIGPLRDALRDFKPHVVFNLLEEFREEAYYDYVIVNYLQLHRTPYTGCSAPGLLISRDKALSKKILAYHRIRSPKFMVVPCGRKVRRRKGLEFPLIVKCLGEDASFGISQASVVHNDEKLAERVEFVHKLRATAIVEEFIPGREIYLGILGNQRLTAFPVWELYIDNRPEGAPLIATAKAKWDLAYQERLGVMHGQAELDPAFEAKVQRMGKRIYRKLGLDGYARIDFRLHDDGRLFFLEANANPQIASDEEFAHAGEAAGYEYGELLEKIVSLGIARG